MKNIIKIISALAIVTSLSACDLGVYIDEGPRVGTIEIIDSDELKEYTTIINEDVKTLKINLFEDVVAYEFNVYQYLDDNWMITDTIKRDKVDDEIEVMFQFLDGVGEIIIKENDEVVNIHYDIISNFNDYKFKQNGACTLMFNKEVELGFKLDNDKPFTSFKDSKSKGIGLTLKVYNK